MIWPLSRKTSPKKHRKQLAKRQRRLRVEPLESRRVLAGLVSVDIFPIALPGTLVLTGDGSNNEVEVQSTGTSGEYLISGLNGTLLELNGAGVTMTSLTVNGITGDIDAAMGTGNDTFRFSGPTAGGTSNIPTDLTITNDDGSNLNVLTDVLINGDLSVDKLGGSSGYSELQIAGSTVIGDTTIDNVGAGSGDSMTTIDSSSLQGGGGATALMITNGAGDDVFALLGNSQVGTGAFIGPQPILLIDNGDGGSRTSFTGASQVAGPGTSTIYGDILLLNGTNIAGTMDILSFNLTNVLGTVIAVNGDGTTETTIMDSTLGSHAAAGLGGPLFISNDSGFDDFTMSGSTVQYGVDIDNDVAAGGTSTSGSSTQISTSSLGTHPLLVGDALSVSGDDGADDVSLDAVTLGAPVDLSLLFDGNNDVDILNGTTMPILALLGGSGNDSVLIDNSTISIDVSIELLAGADTLEIRNIDPLTQWPDPLLGLIVLDGGLGVDSANLDAITLGALDFEITIP